MRAATDIELCVEGSGTQTLMMTARDNRGGEVLRHVRGGHHDHTERNRAAYGSPPSERQNQWLLAATTPPRLGLRAYDRTRARRRCRAAVAGAFVAVEFVVDPALVYKLWVRLKADGNSWANDSVWVQFAGAANAAGKPSLSRGDNLGPRRQSRGMPQLRRRRVGLGRRRLGRGQSQRRAAPLSEGGTQQISIQPREDGVSIDQIILSAERYLTTRPGKAKNDTTIVPKTQ